MLSVRYRSQELLKTHVLTGVFVATKNTSLSNCNAPIRDHGPGYMVVSWILIVLAAIFVIIRFAFKIFEHHDLGEDDWAVLATLCGGIACHAVTLCAINQGLGSDLWTLRLQQITQMLLFFEILAVLYFATLMLLKLSTLFFYIKVFTTPRAARLLWGTALFTFVWGVVYIIVAIFQCQPISFFWNRWDGLHEGTCLNIMLSQRRMPRLALPWTCGVWGSLCGNYGG